MGLFMQVMIVLFFILFVMFSITFTIVFIKSQRVRLRDPLNNSKYISDIWVMEYVDKTTGDRIWKNVKLFFPNFNTVRPPEEAIDVGAKGRLYAEAYKISEDEYVWITDKGITEDSILLKNKIKFSEAFKPFSATQRTVLINQRIKAEETNKAKKWTAAEVFQFTVFLGFIGILVMGMIFLPDTLKEWRNIQSAQESMLNHIDEITSNVAVISSALGAKIEGIDVQYTQNIVSSKNINSTLNTKNEQPPVAKK